MKKLILLLLAALLLCGCARSFNSQDCAQAVILTLFKGDYTQYADLTGQSTALISSQRAAWLDNRTDLLLRTLGAPTPSEEMKKRVSSLLTTLYSKAEFEVSPGEEEVTVTVTPVTLIPECAADLAAQASAWNERNEAYEFADLSPEAYNDAYLDSLLPILESRLTAIPTGSRLTLTLPLKMDDNGLYALPADALEDLAEKAVSFDLPEPETESETAETEAPAESGK